MTLVVIGFGCWVCCGVGLVLGVGCGDLWALCGVGFTGFWLLLVGFVVIGGGGGAGFGWWLVHTVGLVGLLIGDGCAGLLGAGLVVVIGTLGLWGLVLGVIVVWV